MKKTSVLMMVTLLLAGLTLASCEKERHPVGSSGLTGFDENGASEALFSVSTSKRVRFSRGNLQYMVSTNSWAFAQNQYDYTGTYSATLFDLFGWGTSGWPNPAQCYDPTSTSNWNADYWPGGSTETDLDFLSGCDSADWGVYNAITNGGNAPGMWRTLSSTEWQFLLGITADSARIGKWGTATVADGYHGMILLPDVWECPDGLDFNPGAHGWDNNVYSASQWGEMESAGAIFLPAGGCRYANGVDNASEAGYYWSTTHYSAEHAYYMGFNAESMGATNRCFRSNGLSVRLVMDYK